MQARLRREGMVTNHGNMSVYPFAPSVQKGKGEIKKISSLTVRNHPTNLLFSSKHCPRYICWLQLMESSGYFCPWLDVLHTCTALHQIKPALQEIRLSLCNLQMQLTSATLWPLDNKSDCNAALISARHSAESLSSAGRQRHSLKYFAPRLSLDVLIFLNSC